MPLTSNIKVMGILLEGATLLCLPPFSVSVCVWEQLLKERICSSRRNFFSLEVDHISKSYLIGSHASYYTIMFGKKGRERLLEQSVY